jgi:hypothetical protein
MYNAVALGDAEERARDWDGGAAKDFGPPFKLPRLRPNMERRATLVADILIQEGVL